MPNASRIVPRTAREAPDREDARDVAERLVEAFDAFGPAYVRLLGRGGRSGISWSQLRVLQALHCDGPLMLSELGSRLGVTRRNVTSLVDRLERDGLARRVAHPADRRAILLELTRDGEAFGERHYASQRAKAVDLFKRIPSAEQEHLLDIIERLRSEME